MERTISEVSSERSCSEPVRGTCYVGDIAYLQEESGRSLYLATAIDLYSRRLGGE